ncbi:serine protease, partial [Erwinia persicina]|nr:serine protease [Erwinia persicina]
YSKRINDMKTGKTLYKDVSLYIPYARFKDWLNDAVKS